MRCDDLAEVLPAVADGSTVADRAARRHVERCLRCQAELVPSRKLLRDKREDALGDLPPKLRAVVLLRDGYDLPHEAIAAELGISESAAKVRLHRARRKLREAVFPSLGAGHRHDDGEVADAV